MEVLIEVSGGEKYEKGKKGRKKTGIYQDFKMIKILMQVVVVLYHYELSWLTEIVEFH